MGAERPVAGALSWIVAGVGLGVPMSSALAQEWQITPRLGVVETYSDNIGLTTSDAAKSDLVQQVNPGISVAHYGPHLKLHADYTMQNLFYLDTPENNHTSHLLAASGNAEFVRNVAFMDFRADIRRESASLLGPVTAQDVNTGTEISTVRTLLLSPYVRERFGNFGTAEARLTRSQLASNANGGTLNSADTREEAKFDSGTEFREFGWGLSGYHDQVDYKDSRSVQASGATALLNYRLQPRLRWINTVGYEKNDYLNTGEQSSGSLWSTGLQWTPSALTSLEASIGHRFFGPTYTLKFDHHSRLIHWNLNYTQEVTTSIAQFVVPASQSTISALDGALKAQFPNPADRAAEVNYLLNTFARQLGNVTLTSQAYLEKRLEGTLAYSTAKTIAVLNVYDITRDAQSNIVSLTPSDFSLSKFIRTDGIGGFVNVQVTPRISANGRVSYSRYNFRDVGRTDNLSTLSVGAAAKVTSKATATVELRHSQRTSSDSTADYRENALSAALTLLF